MSHPTLKLKKWRIGYAKRDRRYELYLWGQCIFRSKQRSRCSTMKRKHTEYMRWFNLFCFRGPDAQDDPRMDENRMRPDGRHRDTLHRA